MDTPSRCWLINLVFRNNI
ncbi:MULTISPECIES: YsgD/CorL family protein [Pantoea]